jgi:hypothetical protein
MLQDPGNKDARELRVNPLDPAGEIEQPIRQKVAAPNGQLILSGHFLKHTRCALA